MFLNYFLLYVLTIAVVRAWLKIFPKHGPTMFGFRPHHWAYGLVLVIVSFLFQLPALAAIGAALIVDEIPLFFIFKGLSWPDDHWKQYNSWASILGVIGISLFGYLIQPFL